MCECKNCKNYVSTKPEVKEPETLEESVRQELIKELISHSSINCLSEEITQIATDHFKAHLEEIWCVRIEDMKERFEKAWGGIGNGQNI